MLQEGIGLCGEGIPTTPGARAGKIPTLLPNTAPVIFHYDYALKCVLTIAYNLHLNHFSEFHCPSLSDVIIHLFSQVRHSPQ